MTAWNAAAALDAPPPEPRPRRRNPAPVRRSRPDEGRRVVGGVVWIAFVALLLTGVVALNVAVLRLNIQLDRLGRERAALRAQNAALASQLSSSRATARIQRLARKELGLVPADPEETTYVELPGSR